MSTTEGMARLFGPGPNAWIGCQGASDVKTFMLWPGKDSQKLMQSEMPYVIEILKDLDTYGIRYSYLRQTTVGERKRYRDDRAGANDDSLWHPNDVVLKCNIVFPAYLAALMARPAHSAVAEQVIGE